ncbi:MAG: hypothetical protein ACRDQ7_07535, partial [Haloechinothrix sp.]
LVEALGNIRTVIADAEPADKAEVYGHLGLKLTYNPGKRTMGAEIALDAQSWGYGRCPEADTYRAIKEAIAHHQRPSEDAVARLREFGEHLLRSGDGQGASSPDA